MPLNYQAGSHHTLGDLYKHTSSTSTCHCGQHYSVLQRLTIQNRLESYLFLGTKQDVQRHYFKFQLCVNYMSTFCFTYS